jgi:hypothetical protein
LRTCDSASYTKRLSAASVTCRERMLRQLWRQIGLLNPIEAKKVRQTA